MTPRISLTNRRINYAGGRIKLQVLLFIFSLLLGLFCCFGVVLDAFQTIILPRRPKGRFRITRLFFLITWKPWVTLADLVKIRRLRDQFFSIFGPLSLILLLVVWATLLTVGFGLIYFALGSPFHDALNPRQGWLPELRADLYVSGTTLFTLGPGDVTPLTHLARALVVFEAGTGLGFVALVIGYVPVLYQAFSRREVSVALLDGRAGSPPTSAELLRRHGYQGGEVGLISLLAEWERWSAEVLESHVSYPVLCYYRSQHDHQNWLSALIAILDSCALLITIVEGTPLRQAQLTFAMARHALIDLGQIFHVDKGLASSNTADRLPSSTFRLLCEALGDINMRLCGDEAARQRLHAIRALYEPQAFALCAYLRLSLPLWVAEPDRGDQGDNYDKLAAASESALRANEHISDRALTAHLLDDEHGG